MWRLLETLRFSFNNLTVGDTSADNGEKEERGGRLGRLNHLLASFGVAGGWGAERPSGRVRPILSIEMLDAAAGLSSY